MLACCVMLSGCAVQPEEEAEPAETYVVYQALPLPDLFVEIPENYQKTSSQAYKEYYISGDASIIITEDTRQAQYTSAYDYSITALNEYENVTASLNYLSSETLTTGCVYKMQTMEFEYTLTEEPDATKMSCLAGYMTDGASMYIITCKSSSATYPSHKNEFLQVMQSAVISK